jgi:integrase
MMDPVIIGVDPHKLSVTIEARDTREILRATGRFGTDARSYRQLLRRQQQDADREQADGAWIETGLVFTTRYGTPIEPRNFNRRITKAKVPKITVHSARRTCGSLLAASP